ncbi:MAG: hypothetical protein E6L03_09895 [Thaumarchaeota archaeon]|nr:MAG: hypothetical protein E6L03_09895 [Nitrososphaerota archaeon]
MSTPPPSQPYPPVRGGRSSGQTWAFVAVAVIAIIAGYFVLVPIIQNSGCTTTANGPTCNNGSATNILGNNNVWIVVNIHSTSPPQETITIQVLQAPEITSCNWIFCQVFGSASHYSLFVNGSQSYSFANIPLKMGFNDNYQHSLHLANPTPPSGHYTLNYDIAPGTALAFSGSCAFTVPLDPANPFVCAQK